MISERRIIVLCPPATKERMEELDIIEMTQPPNAIEMPCVVCNQPSYVGVECQIKVAEEDAVVVCFNCGLRLGLKNPRSLKGESGKYKTKFGDFGYDK